MSSTSSQAEPVESAARIEAAIFQAPSPHNTQPWILRWLAPDCFSLTFDRSRWLRWADPTERDAWLCMGAAIMNARTMAASFGLALSWRKRDDDIEVRLESSPSTSPIVPTSVIWDRQTSRGRYRPATVPDTLDARLHEVAEPFSVAKLEGGQATLVHGLLRTATAAQFANREVHRELYEWLRFSADHRDQTRDGLSFDVLGLSAPLARLAQLVLYPRTMRVLTAARLHWRIARLANADAQATPHYYLLWSRWEGHEPAQLIEAGEHLQAQWLVLAQEGWYTHPASAILDVPEASEALRAALNLNPETWFLALYRVGKSVPPARSLRRPPLVSRD